MIPNILSRLKQCWRDFPFIKKLKLTEMFYDFFPDISL